MPNLFDDFDLDIQKTTAPGDPQSGVPNFTQNAPHPYLRIPHLYDIIKLAPQHTRLLFAMYRRSPC